MIRRQGRYTHIGLDIGATGMRMLQLADRDGEPAVQAAAHLEFPSAVESWEERWPLILRGIRDALSSQPFFGRDVVIALGTGEFQLKNIRLPKMPPDEMEAAVQFEAQDRFELGDCAAQLRYLPAGEVRHGNEVKEEVIVFAARDELVAQRLGQVVELGLRPVAIDLTPCAVARSFIRYLRRSEDASAVNVFMEIGRRGSCVVITRGTEIVFIKLIDIGGDEMNAAVARAMKLSATEAAELRVRIMRDSAGRKGDPGHTASSEIQARVQDALRPLAERISRDVQLCLRYFAVTFRGQRPDSLTLIGGEAHEPVLMNVLTREVDIPCTIGNPLRGVGRAELTATREQKTLQPAWSVAMGLALRGSPWIRSSRPAGAASQNRPAAVVG